MILKRQIFLPSPEDFNDPFDCAPWMVFDGTALDRKRFYNAAAALDGNLRSRKARRLDLRFAAKEAKSPARREAMEAKFAADAREHCNTAGVFSMSTVNDHILMWSHYADAHKGICLRFDPPADQFFRNGQQVTYQANRPAIHVFKEPFNRWVSLSLLTKADFWAYENEWRVLDLKARSTYVYKPGALSGIILGARISADDEMQVRTWAQGSGEAVEILRAKFDQRQFRLHIETAP